MKNKNIGRIVLGVIILLLIIASVFYYSIKSNNYAADELLMEELIETSRFINAENVADWIINRDPSLILIDVRSKEEFDKFSLPGARNIPLKAIEDDDNLNLLKGDEFKFVFISNDGIEADHAWMLSKMNGCEESYVLSGGLNSWMENILKPQKPLETASKEELELYELRSGMRNYFLGLSRELEAEKFVTAPKVIQPKPEEIPVTPKKKKKPKPGEGC